MLDMVAYMKRRLKPSERARGSRHLHGARRRKVNVYVSRSVHRHFLIHQRSFAVPAGHPSRAPLHPRSALAHKPYTARASRGATTE